jgi:hypothetical protein
MPELGFLLLQGTLLNLDYFISLLKRTNHEKAL